MPKVLRRFLLLFCKSACIFSAVQRENISAHLSSNSLRSTARFPEIPPENSARTARKSKFCIDTGGRVCYNNIRWQKVAYLLCLSRQNSERYRSGYNGTVLKTVVRQRTVGSNPTLSAIWQFDRLSILIICFIRQSDSNPWGFRRNNFICLERYNMQKYSSWWRGAPAKGVGRATGARVRVSPSAPKRFKFLILQRFEAFFFFAFYLKISRKMV